MSDASRPDAGSFVLLVDPDPTSREAIAGALRRCGHEVVTGSDGGDLVRLARSRPVEVAAFDLALPDMTWTEALRCVREARPAIGAILLTEIASMEVAVEALRAGADDYIAKATAPVAVPDAVARIVSHRAAPAPLAGSGSAPSMIESRPGASGMIGSSPAMIDVYKTVARTADLNATVLITGETGSGKEQVARAIHAAGKRAALPFVAVDCAAIPETLFESEFFGHERGAFTGATVARRGVLEAAGAGTCFLDEVGELPLHQQAKLLRALQERAVRRVGSSHTVPIGARMICATNRDLADLVQRGTFREDLYYRLNVVSVRLPPLRQRPDDIRRLVEHFVRKSTAGIRPPPAMSREALDILIRYPWPGNVRQLENVIERTVALTQYPVILPADLPVDIQESDRLAEKLGGGALHTGDPVAIRDLTRRHIDEVLRKTGGNKLRAAQVLGIDRRTLYRILERSTDRTEREAPRET